jgi:hypothetical protein
VRSISGTAPVAVKLLDLHDFGGSGEALARFHRETLRLVCTGASSESLSLP